MKKMKKIQPFSDKETSELALLGSAIGNIFQFFSQIKKDQLTDELKGLLEKAEIDKALLKSSLEAWMSKFNSIKMKMTEIEKTVENLQTRTNEWQVESLKMKELIEQKDKTIIELKNEINKLKGIK